MIRRKFVTPSSGYDNVTHGGRNFFRDIRTYLPNYTASHAKGQRVQRVFERLGCYLTVLQIHCVT